MMLVERADDVWLFFFFFTFGGYRRMRKVRWRERCWHAITALVDANPFYR